MDNYIIRIYRCEKDNPRMIVGMVEKVGLDGRKAFTNLQELWEILNPGRPGSPDRSIAGTGAG